MTFLEKLQEWYGKHLDQFEPVKETQDVMVYIVKTGNKIEFARIFNRQNPQISIDRRISLDEYNIFDIIVSISKFSMGIEKWLV